MSLANTRDRYGTVAKALHWATAALILTAIPLGVIANRLPYATAEEFAAKAQLFSLHKTLGIAAFLVALARICWALTQARPAPLHPDRRAETFAAETVHWMLYASLVLVPLSGWLHHAATEGFAPILWPLGQSLPLVPKDAAVAHMFASLHWVFTKILVAALLLHLAGALKHALIDRDGTLARMWFGRAEVAAPPTGQATRAPVFAAAAVWLAALGAGLALAGSEEAPATPGRAAVESQWQVQEGTLAITVRQLGAEVQGGFATWTAAIDFAPETGTGAVTVTVDIASLMLGSVTGQALGPEFFDAARHPTATFAAKIRPEGEAFAADGTLTLKGAEAPLSLPFALSIEGDTARMQGTATLDRRAFGIGPSFTDESQVGFIVEVAAELTATRAP